MGARGEGRWGVRRTAVVVAAATTAVALLAGGLLVLFFLQRGVLSSAEVSARALSQELAASYRSQPIRDGALPRSSVTYGGATVQIVDPQLRVVASSELPDEPSSHATSFPSAGSSVTSRPTTWLSLADPDDTVTATTGFRSGNDEFAVVVAMSVAVQLDTVATVGVYLLVATPLLVALVGWGTARVVGGALQPVSRIREQVDQITRDRLADRVDVPATDDEIESLAETMNAMLDRLDEADRAQRRFVADASHELRSPIASVGAAIEVINDEGPQAWSELGPMIAGENSRLAKLVDNLLALAKAEDGGQHLDLRPCDLDDLIEGEVAVLRAATKVVVSVEVEPVQTRCDVARIRQVFRNLLDNAGRFARSSVRVRCAQVDNVAVIDIVNDGPLIATDDRERIFDRFVKLDTSRSGAGGSSGLGLAIVREHCRAHGGTVEATVSDDGQCMFRVRLPIRSTLATSPTAQTGSIPADGSDQEWTPS